MAGWTVLWKVVISFFMSHSFSERYDKVWDEASTLPTPHV